MADPHHHHQGNRIFLGINLSLNGYLLMSSFFSLIIPLSGWKLPQHIPKFLLEHRHHIQLAPLTACRRWEDSLAAINGFHSYKCFHQMLSWGKKGEKKCSDSSRGTDFSCERLSRCKELGMNAIPAGNYFWFVHTLWVHRACCFSPSDSEHRSPKKSPAGRVQALCRQCGTASP